MKLFAKPSDNLFNIGMKSIEKSGTPFSMLLYAVQRSFNIQAYKNTLKHTRIEIRAERSDSE